MSLEKDDPIPPGYYWLDLLRPNHQLTQDALDNFRIWMKSFNPRTVKSVKTDGAWVLFEVEKPSMRWGVEDGLGLPNRAPWGLATTKQSVLSDRREPEGIADYWIRSGIESTAKAADAVKETGALDKLFDVSGLGWAIGLYAVSKLLGKR